MRSPIPSSRFGSHRGFSLIELMLVVAITGVLASIAVPAFNNAVLRSRRAEATPILFGVGLSEQAYFGTHDAWVDAPSNPGSPIGKTLRPWDPTMEGWDELGFEPDGLVRCTYFADVYGGETYARVTAYCDVDDDNVSYIERYYVPSTSTSMSNHGFTVVNPVRF